MTELKGGIEAEAGVMCWQDVDRLVGGKDLEREMEAGIKHADVVVLFLDDGYTRSSNCRKEYLFATKHGKYIIPVLLRRYNKLQQAEAAAIAINGAGTTGRDMNSGSEIDGAHSKCNNNSQWWPESMSSLTQFEPILLAEENQLESVLFEVCERIQSRFHRAQRFPTADDAVAYLRDYSSWGVARKAFLTEHMSASTRREEVEEHLARAFAKIDVDGNNFIDEAELAAFLDDNQLSLSREQISTILLEADIDCDGLLSQEELKLAIFSVLYEGTEEQDSSGAAGGRGATRSDSQLAL